eukprot:5492599-Karenia_brevis.AAC.1
MGPCGSSICKVALISCYSTVVVGSVKNICTRTAPHEKQHPPMSGPGSERSVPDPPNAPVASSIGAVEEDVQREES